MSVELFGINIDDFNFEQAVNKAKDLIVQNQVSQVITINPEIIERAVARYKNRINEIVDILLSGIPQRNFRR